MRLELVAGAATVTADAADPATRTITGPVITYGEFGNTSAGRLAVAPGALTLPGELRRLKLFSGHDRDHPVAYALTAEDAASGLTMRFRVARTPAGDAALLEAAEGIRDGFSIELDDVVTDAAGVITAARLVAVALVPLPAYENARVADVAASQPEGPVTMTAPAPAPAAADLADLPSATDTPRVATAAPAPAVAAADTPATPAAPLNAISRPSAVRAGAAPGSLHAAAAILAQYQANSQDPAVAAALADITYTSLSDARQPGWLGELWSGVRFRRRITPRLTNQPLSSYKFTGWQFLVKPTGGAYAGDKAAIPSNPTTVEPVSLTAKRWAGGNDIDRAVIDFGDTEYLDAYSREMADDYAAYTDADAFAVLLAAAGAAVAAPDLSTAIVQGVLSIGATGLSADNVLISEDLLLELAGVTVQNTTPIVAAAIGGLDMSGLLDLTYPALPSRTVLMWAKQAATFRELPGSPLRFDALELARGGVDRAFFGYLNTFAGKPGAVYSCTVAPPVLGAVSAPATSAR